MNDDIKKQTLIEAYNFMFDVTVKGDDTLRLANAMARVRSVIEELQKCENSNADEPTQDK